jgi:hypothetical protein
MLMCGTCLVLMFFETAFGICIGCKIYNTFTAKKAELCPGGVCEFEAPAGAGGNWIQGLVVVVFLAAVVSVANWVNAHPTATHNTMQTQPQIQTEPSGSTLEDDRCKVPAFAKAMGHEEKWKLHNNCQ